ncbi:hypothetical protein D3C77_711890 [compost metagenome]
MPRMNLKCHVSGSSLLTAWSGPGSIATGSCAPLSRKDGKIRKIILPDAFCGFGAVHPMTIESKPNDMVNSSNGMIICSMPVSNRRPPTCLSNPMDRI